MYSERIIWVAPEKLVYKQMLLPFCFVPAYPFDDDYVDMVADISRRDTSWTHQTHRVVYLNLISA